MLTPVLKGMCPESDIGQIARSIGMFEPKFCTFDDCFKKVGKYQISEKEFKNMLACLLISGLDGFDAWKK